MNLNVLNAWYNGIDNTIYAASCADICWTLKKINVLNANITMRKRGFLQLALQLNFWVAITISNLSYLCIHTLWMLIDKLIGW
jgi:hypothetical protein